MTEKMDILNRQPFVDRLIDIVRLLADNHKGCTFAIDGSWGCGKSFILEMFEKQISLFQDPAAAGDRYALFHYNCWQYDYYEEPAIAICASIREQAKKASRLFPDTDPMLQSVINLGKQIGKELLCNFVETKFGVTTKMITDTYAALKTGKAEVVQSRREEYLFDTYFEFRTVLEKTRSDLSELSKDKPIIIVVDELDRCLPEYAIAVLERLHHLFDQQENILVILAIDKARLTLAIQKVYGIDPDSVPDFLRKYISFSLDVDNGSLTEYFWDRHIEYLSLFKKPTDEEMVGLNDLAVALFGNMDIRSQEKVLESCITLHKLLGQDNADLSLLYFELIHQAVLFKTQKTSCIGHLAELNKTGMPSFDEKMGVQASEYLMKLEKFATSSPRKKVNNIELKVLENTPAGQAFAFFASLKHPRNMRVCRFYSLDRLTCNDSYFMLSKLFHELACLMH